MRVGGGADRQYPQVKTNTSGKKTTETRVQPVSAPTSAASHREEQARYAEPASQLSLHAAQALSVYQRTSLASSEEVQAEWVGVDTYA